MRHVVPDVSGKFAGGGVAYRAVLYRGELVVRHPCARSKPHGSRLHLLHVFEDAHHVVASQGACHAHRSRRHGIAMTPLNVSSARTVAVFPAPEAPVTMRIRPTDTQRYLIELTRRAPPCSAASPCFTTSRSSSHTRIRSATVCHRNSIIMLCATSGMISACVL